MKIKLVSPKMSLRPMDSEYKRLLSPPISLLVLSALTPKEHLVEIIDENLNQNIDYSKCDLVGINCNIDTFQNAISLAKKFKANGSPIIMGGLFPSSNPELVLKNENVDSVCIGEAEELWGQILEDARKGKLLDRYRSDHFVEPAIIPIPDWNNLNKRNYLYSNIVITSRGCPYKCDFCYNSCDYVFKRFRRRPIDHVIDEIKLLKTKQVMFVDDNFIGDYNWVIEFCKRIKPLELTWHAAVSADIGRKSDLLDLMAESGCRSLFIGFETINQLNVINSNKRQNNVAEYDETIRQIHKRSIMINASLVFGFDTDTKDVFRSTLNWLVQNKIETMTAHILTPYPGTLLYKKMIAQKRIINTNFQDYNTSKVVFIPKNMTEKELLEGYLWIYKEFYSFSNIIRRMPTSRKQWRPYLLFNFGYRKFGKLTSLLGKFGLMSKIGELARQCSYGIQ